MLSCKYIPVFTQIFRHLVIARRFRRLFLLFAAFQKPDQLILRTETGKENGNRFRRIKYLNDKYRQGEQKDHAVCKERAAVQDKPVIFRRHDHSEQVRRRDQRTVQTELFIFYEHTEQEHQRNDRHQIAFEHGDAKVEHDHDLQNCRKEKLVFVFGMEQHDAQPRGKHDHDAVTDIPPKTARFHKVQPDRRPKIQREGREPTFIVCKPEEYVDKI